MRKRLERWLVLALVLSIALSGTSYAASSGRGRRRGVKEQEPETQQEPEQEKQEEPAPEEPENTGEPEAPEAPEAPEEPETESEFLELSITREIEFLEPEDRSFNVMIEYPVFSMAGEENGPLLEALRENSGVMADVVREVAEEIYAELESAEGVDGYVGVTAMAQRADREMVSILVQMETDRGEESEYASAQLNLDPATGEEFALADVVADQEALVKALMKELFAAYPDEGFNEDMEDTLAWLIGEDGITWTLGNTSLFVIIPPDVLTYSGKRLAAALPFAENPGLVDGRFTEPKEAYVERILPEARYRIGADEKLFYAAKDEFASGEDNCTALLNLNGLFMIRNYYGYMPDMYLVHEGQRDYLYVTVPHGDLGQETEVFDLGGAQLEEPEIVDMAFAYGYTPADPARMHMLRLGEDDLPEAVLCALGDRGLPEVTGPDEAAGGTTAETGEKEEKEETEEKDGKEEKDAGEETGAVSVLPVGVYPQWLGHDGGNVWYDANYQLVWMDGEKGLEERLARYNKELVPAVHTFLDEYEELAKTLAEDGLISLEEETLEIDAGSCVRRSDSHVLSIAQIWEQKGLLDLGEQRILGVNIDPETGSDLLLSDVVADMDRFRELLTEKVQEYVPSEEFDYTPAQLVADLLSDGDRVSTLECSWSAGYEGISFFFNTSINFPYFGSSSGVMEVFLPYAAEPEVYADWCRDTPACYGFSTGLGKNSAGEFFIDTDGDGTYEDILLVPRNEDDLVSGFYLLINDGFHSFDFTDGTGLVYDVSAYCLRAGGQDYLWVNSLSEADEVGVYRFADGGVEWVGNYPGSVDFLTVLDDSYYTGDPDGSEVTDGSVCHMPLDPENVVIRERSAIFGYHWLENEYRAGGDGMPEAKDDVYEYVYYYDGLTLKRSMTFEKVEDGELTGEELEVAGNEWLRLMRTDGESWIDMQREDGVCVRVFYEPDGDDWSVGGHPASEVFDGIYYY